MTIQLCPVVAEYLDTDPDNFVEWLIEHQVDCEHCQRVLEEIQRIKEEENVGTS